MKKKYIIPESVAFELQLESTVAMSMTDDTLSSQSDIRTNRQGFDEWDEEDFDEE